MWISQVELHNIKSYGHQTKIDLAQGVNAICGQNGAGKSTILEAIGYALFGKSSYKNQDQFINEKAKKGEIVVTVVDSRDDRCYQVLRPIKGGSAYVYDPETNHRLAEGTDDVKRWLCECMGVEPTTDLEALFENAVGVAQGLLTASFLQTEANRRKVFDPLLGVEDYKKVWDNMLAVVKHVEKLQHENEKKQERLEGKLEDLPALRNDANSLMDTIQGLELKHAQAIEKLGVLKEKLAQLQSEQEIIQGLEARSEMLARQSESLQAQWEEAKIVLEQARQAQETIDRCEADYQAYEQAQNEQGELEKKRASRDAIQEQLAATKQTLALIQQALETLEDQLQSVAQAETRLIELKPLVEKQEALEQEHQSIEKAMADLAAARTRVKEEEERLANLQKELTEVHSQLDKRKILAQEIEKLQQQRNERAKELDDLTNEITSLETQLGHVRRSLPEAQNRQSQLQSLQTRIKETQEDQTRQQNDLAKMQTELAKRNDLELKLKKLTDNREKRKAELLSLEAQMSTQEAQERQIQASLTEWQTQAQKLNHHQQNFLVSESRLNEAEKELLKIKEGVGRRNNLSEQINALETQQAEENNQRDSAKEELSRSQTRLADITQAMHSLEVEADSPCPVCQKPLSGHDITSLKAHYQTESEKIQAAFEETQANLKQTETNLKRIARQIKQTRTEIDHLPTQPQLEAHQKTVSSYRAEVAKLKQHIADLADAPEQADHAQQRLEQTRIKLAELKQHQTTLKEADAVDENQQHQLQTEINQLARPAEIDRLQNEFEQAQENLAQWQGAVVSLADAPQQVAELESNEQALINQKGELQSQHQQINQEREQLTNEIQQLQAEMNNLATPAQTENLQAAIATQTKTLAGWQSKVSELSQVPIQLEAIRKALTDLGDPRHEQQANLVEANKRSKFESERLQKQKEFELTQEAKANIEVELEPFADLDKALERVKETLTKTTEAHQTYLEQRATAETLPQRELKVVEIQKKVESLTNENNELQQKLLEARAGYNPEYHGSLQTEFEEIRTEQTRLATHLDSKREQLEKLRDKIDKLEKFEAELDTLKQESKRLSHLNEVVSFIRRTIRDAGPEVTKRLVKAISLKADQIFADITDDHQLELTWDETYAITVKRDGYERNFQQLSGGEAMAAALAVRLALLQGMSTVDVAFFDEPTANLDPERRANLAEQMARIKGFSQLVVISHDDTFEQDTHHVIHIGKDEHGYSQVMT